MKARVLNPAVARRAALIALWVQVAALIAYGVYQAIGSSGADLLLNSLDVVLATISLGLWTLLLGDFLRGAGAQGARRAPARVPGRLSLADRAAGRHVAADLAGAAGRRR